MRKDDFYQLLPASMLPLLLISWQTFQKKYAQMMMVTEHLMQSVETEHRIMAPATLTRLHQDMKHIIESQLPGHQKIILLDQLIQIYQGMARQTKSETTATRPVVLAPPTDTGDKCPRYTKIYTCNWVE